MAELEGIEAVGHESASVMVGTAGGKVSVSQLPMRRGDSLAFVTVGTSTGRTCLDQTLLATPGVPEMRECQLLAPKDGTVIGHPSPIFTVTVS